MDIYLVTTPRHWWLSQIIAIKRAEKALLVVFNSFKGAEALYKISSKESSFLFDQVILAPGKLSKDCFNKTWYRNENAQVKKVLNRLVTNFDIQNVFTGNIHAFPVHFLHSKLKKKASFHVLDDGIAFYLPEIRTPKSWIKQLFRSLLLGFFFRSSHEGELYDFFSEGWFLRPNLVDKRFHSLALHNIDQNDVGHEKVEFIKKKVFSLFEFDLKEWNSHKTIIVLTNSEYLAETCRSFSILNFRKKLINLLETLKNDRNLGTIWIKYHPREKKSDFLALNKSFQGVRNIPDGIPFELLLKEITEHDTVIGEFSTILIDVKLVNLRTEVYSVWCESAEKLKLKRMLQDLNVTIDEW